MHLFLALAALAGSPEIPDVGPLVRSLWLVQRHGTAEALDPKNDQRVKAVLSKALAKDGVITLQELGGFMQPGAFKKLAGPDATLDPAETVRALRSGNAREPERRNSLRSSGAHARLPPATTFERMIGEKHREAGGELARWIAANYEPGKSLHITAVCTGNSRRSILGSSMGNIAASYHGMPEVRFHSGGTAPTAFNPRTVAALETPLGFRRSSRRVREAKRGEPKTENPVFRVSWGERLETLEFSKHYGDATNPQKDFAALMVCSEADEGVPVP